MYTSFLAWFQSFTFTTSWTDLKMRSLWDLRVSPFPLLDFNSISPFFIKKNSKPMHPFLLHDFGSWDLKNKNKSTWSKRRIRSVSLSVYVIELLSQYVLVLPWSLCFCIVRLENWVYRSSVHQLMLFWWTKMKPPNFPLLHKKIVYRFMFNK